MINYQKGDIVFVQFPFTGGQPGKDRPALVVLDTGDDDMVVARMTTRIFQTPFDLRLKHWQIAGLNAASSIREHKLLTVKKSLVYRLLGRLHVDDYSRVSTIMLNAYGTW